MTTRKLVFPRTATSYICCAGVSITVSLVWDSVTANWSVEMSPMNREVTLTDRDQIRVTTLNRVLESALTGTERLRLEPDFHRTGLTVGPGEVGN